MASYPSRPALGPAKSPGSIPQGTPPRRRRSDTDARGKYSNPNAGQVQAGSVRDAHTAGVIDKVDRKLGVDSGQWGSGPLGERRANAILSYQRMYNRRNPNGKITEDGKLGRQTLTALGVRSYLPGAVRAIPPKRKAG